MSSERTHKQMFSGPAAAVRNMAQQALRRSTRQSISAARLAPSTAVPQKLKQEPKAKLEPKPRVKTEPAHDSVKPKARKRARTDAAQVKKEEDDSSPPPSPSAPRKQSRVKKVQDDEPLDLPPRVQGSTHFVGAHISSAGGVENAITNARRIGANAFSCFVRPKMQWASKELTDVNKLEFASRVKEFDYTQYVVPHGCYLVNLANPDAEKREKSFTAFMDDLQKCESLGVRLYNFHPGSTVGQCTPEEGCSFIAESINRAHKLTTSVVILIENMAGAGNLIGGKFEHLRSIIDQVENKDRVGVCIDTCHAFAAGYDMRTRETYEATVKALDDIVGLSYVKAMHLNDSKEGLGKCKDRHENIGAGQLGLFPFFALMNDARFANIPLILETPGGGEDAMHKVWQREVSALYKLQGLSEDGTDWDEVLGLLSEVKEIREDSKARDGAKKAAAKERGGKAK